MMKNIFIYIYIYNKEYKRNEIYIEIKKVKIIINHKIKSFSKLFFDCNCIESITFIKLHRTNIIDIKHMFDGCLLKKFSLSNFYTNNVTVTR